MIRLVLRSLFLIAALIFTPYVLAQDQLLFLAFSGNTTGDNQLTVMGAGFGSYPAAAVFFGSVPTDIAFTGATDGRGAIVAASPGQGIMLFGPTLETSNPALIRCSVRTDAAHAAVVMAAIGQAPGIFVGTNTPNNGTYFKDQYRRLSLFVIPPSTGFQPLIQIVNTSDSEFLTVYLDNFEVISIDPDKYYSGRFLDGDETDPSVVTIDLESDVTPTPLRTQTPVTPITTPVATATPSTEPEAGELHIENVTWNYTQPYLLDFNFNLRDENGESFIADPASFQVIGMENGEPINSSDTGARLTRIVNKRLRCQFVLDYTLSMADPNVNGDADSDGISDSIETMELAVKDLIDRMNIDAQTGLYAYHRNETPQQIVGFIQNKDYLKEIVDTILEERVQWRFGVSRCWDAVHAAILEFSETPPADEERVVIFISNGRDSDSVKRPADIVQAARSRNVTVYAIGYGSILDPTDPEAIANQTNGYYYTSDSAFDIADEYQRIGDDLHGRYTLRWMTLKRDSTPFTPAFTISRGELTDMYVAEEPYLPASYTGDPKQGTLRIIASEVVDGRSIVFLRSEYTPQWTRNIRLKINAPVPYTVDRVPNSQGGLCETWNLTLSDAEDSGTWVDLESLNPKNPFTSIPFAAFGSLLKFEFRNVDDISDIISCGWLVDNSGYETSDGQMFSLFGSDTSQPIPACSPTPTLTPSSTATPVPTYTPTPTPTPTPWPEPESRLLHLDLPGLADDAVPFDFIWIPPGTFTMGSPANELDRGTDELQHVVTITKPFYLGRTEVTQAHWQAVMNENPSYYTGKPDNPVENVSWDRCQNFISRLNGLNLGTYRLPAEAEWEYACRAGTQTRYFWGDDLNYLIVDLFAWTNTNANAPQTVGMKITNDWNLFDMSGNVSEWCQDWYGNYTSIAQIDPTGPLSGTARVTRGGGWNSNDDLHRSACRGKASPTRTSYALGLRLVLEVK